MLAHQVLLALLATSIAAERVARLQRQDSSYDFIVVGGPYTHMDLTKRYANKRYNLTAARRWNGRIDIGWSLSGVCGLRPFA